MRRTWIAIAAVVVGVLYVGWLAAFRGGESRVVALADAAERIEGESMFMRFTMGMSDSSGDYSVRGEGPWTADNSRGTADMTITFADEPPFRMKLRNVGRDYWFSSKQLSGILPPGKRWVHSYDRAGPATTVTPSQFASFLAEADDVEEVGEARVHDEAATHYRGVLDVQELADEIGGDTKRQLEAALERENIPEGEKAGLPIEAWLSDDEGLPVRMRIWSSGEEASMDMTIDILEYGVTVDVEPPPADTIIEESEFDRLTGG